MQELNLDDLLLGFSGFVGSTLRKQREFQRAVRSVDVNSIVGGSFGLAVCAAAPAQKWIANKAPDDDRRNIESLIGKIDSIACKRFVLISTVDVFANPIGVDESTEINEAELHAYGLHRRMLEKFVEKRFTNGLIVRLSGLVGPGLRKNVIFDFLNDNNLHAIDSRQVFQFYPMVNLWYDIETALNAGLKLVHLTAEPISVADVASKGFNREFTQALARPPARYDMRSVHSELFGGKGGYQYSIRESIQAIRAYAQSEPRTRKAAESASA